MQLSNAIILMTAAFTFCAFGQPAGTQSEAAKPKPEAAKPKGVHSNNWRGRLVDANCGPGESVAQAHAPAMADATAADRVNSNMSATPTDTKSANPDAVAQGRGASTGSADRVIPSEIAPSEQPSLIKWTSAQWRRCPATASTTAFGIVFSDGRFVQLDGASNAIAATAWKTHTKWMRDPGEAPQVRVKGTLYGNTMHVESFR